MRWWRVTLHPRRGCPLLLPGQGTNRCASRRGERGHQRGWRPRLPAWLATRASTRALIGSSSRNSSRRSRAPTSWIPTARPTSSRAGRTQSRPTRATWAPTWSGWSRSSGPWMARRSPPTTKLLLRSLREGQGRCIAAPAGGGGAEQHVE
ncbi:hypothetical protein T484DRAFT_1922335 [Baffinella frigidus]|nr:hypothetical protein T484DRAFT_1922335 [Cryptophyta sp. CCMP2293]